MNRRSLIPTLAALTALTGLAVASVLAQQPAPGPARTVYETRPDGTLVERPVAGKVVATMQRGPLGTTLQYDDGRSVTYLPGPLDAESQKLINEEQAAAQEAKALAQQAQQAQQGESETAKADAKKKLREKLVAIFDLQQQRRDGEIKKIEDRLARLKETLKKRDAAKDSIVDRRLETLTGGVDELGWEDTFGNPADPYGQQNWSRLPLQATPPLPSPVPTPAVEPRYGLPPTAPRAGAAPAFPVPAPPAIPNALPPATAPVPPAAPAAPAPPVDPVPAVAPAATR